MSIAQNYFLLCHGEQLENLECVPLKQVDLNEQFLQISALILATNRTLFKQYNSFKSFQALCQEISLFIPENTVELNILQFSVIEKLEYNLNSQNIKTVLDTFQYLLDQGILNKDLHRKLISLFDINKLEKKKVIQDSFDETIFCDQKSQLQKFIDQLETVCEDTTAQDILNDTKSYLENQKFSIGITGVINSGKSTMLNALLKQDLLGTAIVPETANLSVLKHSKEPYATVNYWDNQEGLGSAKSTTISLDTLCDYTSAKNTQSKLIKSVEIGTPINFLDESIEIVDTPGLDDPVVLREEITKEYISKCDLMLHLMNVNQSATQKDMEFILDALLYQNITKLLVVVTKADTVSEDELHEVINYVKRSIREKLQSIEYNSKIESILKNLMVIPISATTKMGIDSVEKYLEDTLFGKQNQKTQLILKSTSSKIQKIIDIEKNSLEYQLINLEKSTDQLEDELQTFKKEKIQLEQEYQLIQSDIKTYQSGIKSYLTVLETFLQSEFQTLNEILLRRVVDDINYELKNNKQKPSSDRIKTMITITLNDGILDIIRDYRFKLTQKMETISNQCHQKHNQFEKIEIQTQSFASGFLTASHSVVIQEVLTIIEQTKTSKLSEINTQLYTIIEKENKPLHTKIKQKANDLSIELLEEFFNALNKPLDQYTQLLQTKEDNLKSMIESSNSTQEDKDQLSLSIYKKLEQLQELESDIVS